MSLNSLSVIPSIETHRFAMLLGMRVLFMTGMETLMVRCRACLARRFAP